MILFGRRQARRFLKPRPKESHKGSCGRVLVVAGSRGMIGAGILCAAGAARSGAGLVRLATPRSQQPIAARRAPLEITTLPLPEDRLGRLGAGAWPGLQTAIREWRPDVIAVGPGLGTSPAIQRLVRRLAFQMTIPLVLDADGLNSLALLGIQKLAMAPLVLTPHAGELARLLRTSPARVNADRIVLARRAADRWGAVCLLKGAGTVVTDGKSVIKNTTGNPAMASGGMGDVLTGILAGLWAQRIGTALWCAAVAAYVHGLAGDLAVRRFPERTLLASDLVQYLPAAFKKIRGGL